jgi:hypothetical protein
MAVNQAFPTEARLRGLTHPGIVFVVARDLDFERSLVAHAQVLVQPCEKWNLNVPTKAAESQSSPTTQVSETLDHRQGSVFERSFAQDSHVRLAVSCLSSGFVEVSSSHAQSKSGKFTSDGRTGAIFNTAISVSPASHDVG